MKHILDYGKLPTIDEVKEMLKEIRHHTSENPDEYWIRKAFPMSHKMAAEFARQIGDEDDKK